MIKPEQLRNIILPINDDKIGGLIVKKKTDIIA